MINSSSYLPWSRVLIFSSYTAPSPQFYAKYICYQIMLHDFMIHSARANIYSRDSYVHSYTLPVIPTYRAPVEYMYFENL